MKIDEITGKDLSGWHLQKCYSMELSHDFTKGYYPAVNSENKIIVCLTRHDLKKIWEKIPRLIKVTASYFMVDTNAIAVPICHPSGRDNSLDYFLVSKQRLEVCLDINGYIQWTPGLNDVNNFAFFPKE